MDLNRLNPIFEKYELDAIVSSDGYNMRYISGFSGATGFMFISKKRSVIITDSRYTIQAKEEAPDFEVIEISIKRNYSVVLEELCKEDKCKAIGFDNKSISYSEYKLLKTAFPESVKLVELGNDLEDLREVKSDKEIEYIREAERIGDIAFEKILNIIKPGMTELQVAANLEFIMKEEGAENLSFETIVASGINSSKPHAAPGTKLIEPGDFVTMDFGCMYKGYCSDMTRTVVIGKANDKQKEIFSIVLEAQKRALEGIKAGEECKVIDALARDYIASKGYGECFGHGLGHSVGLFIHETPALSPSSKAVLKSNMLETVEPGIYVEGFGGVRIEDLVVVTETGIINLTSSPKELIII